MIKQTKKQTLKQFKEFFLDDFKKSNPIEYKALKRDKPIIHIEFAPYLHSEYGFFTENIIDLIQKKE